MHVGEIITADCANGVGMRVSVFVSGCTNACSGCFQPETWDFSFGRLYTKEMEDAILRELAHPWYDGLTILGGEPFELSNQAGVCQLVDRVRRELPFKTLWIYTGYVYERDLVPGGRRHTSVTDAIFDRTDVLVDGPFVQAEKDITLDFRGSQNQRLIDMKATRERGCIVEYDVRERVREWKAKKNTTL